MGVRCLHRGADAALRPDWRRRDGGYRANRANGANRLRCVSSAWSEVVALRNAARGSEVVAGRLRCVSSAWSTPKWVQLIITRYNAVVPGWVCLSLSYACRRYAPVVLWGQRLGQEIVLKMG